MIKKHHLCHAVPFFILIIKLMTRNFKTNRLVFIYFFVTSNPLSNDSWFHWLKILNNTIICGKDELYLHTEQFFKSIILLSTFELNVIADMAKTRFFLEFSVCLFV